jgi:hypothetical protein
LPLVLSDNAWDKCKGRALTVAMAWTTSRLSGGLATTAHMAVKWLRRPQGDPSGVCTGHRKPQDSGSSFRTVVVLSCAKYAPRWIALK